MGVDQGGGKVFFGRGVCGEWVGLGGSRGERIVARSTLPLRALSGGGGGLHGAQHVSCLLTVSYFYGLPDSNLFRSYGSI